MSVQLHNYVEVRAYLEKEHADWLRALTPRHINAPADYWPQKVLAVSSVNAAMHDGRFRDHERFFHHRFSRDRFFFRFGYPYPWYPYPWYTKCAGARSSRRRTGTR